MRQEDAGGGTCVDDGSHTFDELRALDELSAWADLSARAESPQSDDALLDTDGWPEDWDWLEGQCLAGADTPARGDPAERGPDFGIMSDGLAQLATAVQTLLAVDRCAMSEHQTLASLNEFEKLSRQLAAIDLRNLAHLDQVLQPDRGEQAVAAILRDALRVSAGSAKARARAASELGPRRALTGAALQPKYAHLAEAQAAGVASVEQASVIIRTVNRLPGHLRADFSVQVEKTLVEHAGVLGPRQLERLGSRLLAQLDPDGAEPRDEANRNVRSLRLIEHPDGSGEIRGRLTALAFAFVKAALAPFVKSQQPSPGRPTDAPASEGSKLDDESDADTACAKSGFGRTPTRSDEPDGDSYIAGDNGGIETAAHAAQGPTMHGQPRPEDLPRDDRSWEQRQHDAFEDLLRTTIKDPRMPRSGGTSTTLVVTMTLRDLERRIGYATTSHGGVISISDALRHATETKVVPILFDDLGGVLAYGRAKRLVPSDMRRALDARDQGCSFPGCDRPPNVCEAHHTPAWASLGETNLDQVALLCEPHHDNHERDGWSCQFVDGRPHWLPPAWLDRSRRPIRNTAHDRP